MFYKVGKTRSGVVKYTKVKEIIKGKTDKGVCTNERKGIMEK
jgi:hypothetical protein